MMEFTTIEEALNAQVRCETCGRPKKTTEAVYFNGGGVHTTGWWIVWCRTVSFIVPGLTRNRSSGLERKRGQLMAGPLVTLVDGEVV